MNTNFNKSNIVDTDYQANVTEEKKLREVNIKNKTQSSFFKPTGLYVIPAFFGKTTTYFVHWLLSFVKPIQNYSNKFELEQREEKFLLKNNLTSFVKEQVIKECLGRISLIEKQGIIVTDKQKSELILANFALASGYYHIIRY